MKTINKIDVHHHIFPKEYLDALKVAGVKKSFGVDFPEWNVDISLKNAKFFFMKNFFGSLLK